MRGPLRVVPPGAFADGRAVSIPISTIYGLRPGSGHGERLTNPGGPTPEPTRNTIDLLGVFTQVSYRFDPDHPVPAKPGGLALPFFKAPVGSAAYSWTGFYGGIEGGGTFGQSKQIGQTIDRTTFDSTPDFDVDGGLVGGTLG